MPMKAKRISDPLELELAGGWEPQCWCWQSNPGPLGEQPVVLTTCAVSPAPCALSVCAEPLIGSICLHYFCIPRI